MTYNPDDPTSSHFAPPDETPVTAFDVPNSFTTGEHQHHYHSLEENHPDGLVTALCSCGAGLMFHPSVHYLEAGQLKNHGAE